MTDRKRKPRKSRRTMGEREESSLFPAPLKHVLWALLITAVLGLLLLLVASALLLRTKDPDRYHTAVGIATLYLTAFLGGVIATRLNGRHAPIFCGLAEALLLLLLLTVPMFLLPDTWRHTYTGAQTVGLRALIFPASLLGAMVAAMRRTPKRRHR